MSGAWKALSEIRGARTARDVPLSGMTTWRVGGPAEFLVRVEAEEALSSVLRVARDERLPLMVLGNGSNVLVSDEGLAGIVVRLDGGLAAIEVEATKARAGGGALLSSLATEAYRGSLTGLEFSFGIPGTVGGAVMMNAGAFGSSISRVLESVETMDRNGLTGRVSSFEEGYRSPLVPASDLVVYATFRLEIGEPQAIRERMDSVRARRRATQPWGMSTAGSVFKNPPGDHAGRLIEECGLKGRGVGGARFSDIHANFIINNGTASAGDIKELIGMAREEVRKLFGVELELEVGLVGFDGE